MFKAQVLRRNFTLFNTVPYSRIARAAARDGHGTVTIQRVVIQKPFWTRSRLAGAVAIGAATYCLGRFLGIEVEIVDDQHQEEPQQHSQSWQDVGKVARDEQELEDHDGGEHAVLLFLPTGLSRPKPKSFYRGSDPEWREFRKLATDRPRVDKIRGELATLIRQLAQKNPSYVARLGKIDASKGNMWVEFRFPDGPPTEYERPGVELTEHLEWRKATRPVQDMHHQRLSKLLYPTEASTALYQDTKRRLLVSWNTIKSSVGWEDRSQPDTVQQVFQRALANSPPPPGTDASSVPPPTDKSASTISESSPSASSASSLDNSAKDLGFVLPDPKKLTLDLTNFRQDFRKAFKPYSLPPPRGSFLVLGLIEVYGERSRLTLNVTAFYDPKQGRYVGVQGKIWNLVDHRQTPKGGP